MKIFGVLCLLMAFLVNTASAIAPLNETSIKQAQLYGSSQARTELLYFLKPWLAYEEQAEQLNETAETAYLYTSFLLIAMDAREKKLHNMPIRVEDSEKIITDYLDTLSFSVKLSGASEDFSKGTVGVLRQKDKVLKSWSAAVPERAEMVAGNQKKKYEVQAYFYFDDKQLDLKAPITLTITTGDKRTHNFYFELAKIK